MPRWLEGAMKKWTSFLLVQDERVILMNRAVPVIPMVGAFIATLGWDYRRSMAYVAIGGLAKYAILLYVVFALASPTTWRPPDGSRSPSSWSWSVCRSSRPGSGADESRRPRQPGRDLVTVRARDGRALAGCARWRSTGSSTRRTPGGSSADTRTNGIGASTFPR